MKFVLFYHSFTSCWNHGNAHFLRGIARELIRGGHQVSVYEPLDGWSRTNALRDGGPEALANAPAIVPSVRIEQYLSNDMDYERALDGADVVIVHEWNPPELVAALGRRRRQGAPFTLLFHDTHHRAVTAPHDLALFDIEDYDGVLVFGEVLREVYLRHGWGRRVFTWHEAADTALFRPLAHTKETDLVWIGNWGDGERTQELTEFLLEPVRQLGLSARVHGVRYPQEACANLAACGIMYAGWLPNQRVPDAFARARMTVHVPRRPYVASLPGIPTIRMFEALACGIPLICSPWRDVEGLFPAGSYIAAATGAEMTAALSLVLRDADLAAELTRAGLRSIHARHTCTHRAAELIAIIESLQTRTVRTNVTDSHQPRVLAS
ncbi:MAG: glycosyltransferase [Xanthobacteraceae bacterium]